MTDRSDEERERDRTRTKRYRTDTSHRYERARLRALAALARNHPAEYAALMTRYLTEMNDPNPARFQERIVGE